MSVPKCKECKHRRRFPETVYSCVDSPHCFHKTTYTETSMGKLMKAAETKTSPKWCPKRLEIQKEGKK
jgi:hypothetical protein